MLSAEDNELITQTDRGTPMGELFRRFWLPALLSEELPAKNSHPVRVKIMGEKLVAYRDSDGNPGVISAYCPHRGAPMYYGRNEEGGLRCLYHGWKYDLTGQCIDMPNIPNGEMVKKRIQTIAYPTHEAANMIWIYMGPPERKPPFPEFPACALSKENVYATKYEIDCNWLQAQEGDFDPSHVQFIHSTLGEPSPLMAPTWRGGPNSELARSVALVNTEAGVIFANSMSAGDGQMKVTASQFMLPCYSNAGHKTATGPNVQAMNIRVPIDDEHEMHYRVRWDPEGFSDEERWEYTHGGYVFPLHEPGTYRAQENKDNDYGYNPVLQRHFNYSGVVPFPTQDLMMIEDQWGPIQDRTQEHLVASDVRIIFVRQRLIEMAKALENGIEPDEPFKMTDIHQLSTVRGPLVLPAEASLSDDVVHELVAGFHARILSDEVPADLDATKLIDALPADA